MLRHHMSRFIVGSVLAVCALVAVQPGRTRGEAAKAPPAADPARTHWENIVIFFGDEETGEWSLRIRDEDVKDRGWFEYLELWQFDRTEKKWAQIKTDKLAHAIVLPKQKGTDQPKENQVLVELKEMTPNTAGLWYAKWKIDNVACSTLMRVGTGRSTNKLADKPGRGMIHMVVPIDLNKSEAMLIPDPAIYCVPGGPGKPSADDK